VEFSTPEFTRMNDSVSILMPVCGTSQYMAEAVLSVVESGIPYKLLISANGPDEWEECDRIAALLPPYRVEVVHWPEVRTLAETLKDLAERATTWWVMRLDPDDSLPRVALAAMVTAARSVPDPVVYGHYRDFGEVNRIIPCKDITPRALYYYSVGPYNHLVRTDLMQRAGWRETAYEDWDILIRYMELGATPVPLDRVVLNHRVRGDGRLAAGSANNEACIKELRKHHWGYFAESGLC